MSERRINETILSSPHKNIIVFVNVCLSFLSLSKPKRKTMVYIDDRDNDEISSNYSHFDALLSVCCMSDKLGHFSVSFHR